MISPLPGVTHGKPGSAMKALPGIEADVVNDQGESVPNGSGGYLILRKPWPAMLRTIWGDDQRFKDTYCSRWPDVYFASDSAKKADEGAIWVPGLGADVMNVSGHLLPNNESDTALVPHPQLPQTAGV